MGIFGMDSGGTTKTAQRGVRTKSWTRAIREPQGGHLTGPPFGGGLIEVERGAGAVLDAEVPERAGLPAAPGVRRVQAVGGEHAAEVVLAQRLEGLGVQRVGAAPLAEGPELPGVGPDAGVGGILRVIPALEAGQDAAAAGSRSWRRGAAGRGPLRPSTASRRSGWSP